MPVPAARNAGGSADTGTLSPGRAPPGDTDPVSLCATETASFVLRL
jgi:hypothetical protein